MNTAAIIAAVAAVLAALVTAVNTYMVRRLDNRLTKARRTTDFISAKLQQLYLPVSMSLKATKILFDRYFEVDDDAEKACIEHAWKEHNSLVKERMMTGWMYLDPDAPKDEINELLEHLIQWETVYRLKYDLHVYDGPVFAGTRRFGFRRFPAHIDDYFHKRADELSTELHERIAGTQLPSLAS